MSKLLSSKRRRSLAATQQTIGYAIERHQWAGTQKVCYWIGLRPGPSAVQSLLYPEADHTAIGTCSWIEINPIGVHIAGPGHSGGKYYQPTPAGIEQARRDVLLNHVSATLRHADNVSESAKWAKAAIAAALSACEVQS